MSSPVIKREEGGLENSQHPVQVITEQDLKQLVRSNLMKNTAYSDLVEAKSLAWESGGCYSKRRYEQTLAEASKTNNDVAIEFFQSHLQLAEEMNSTAKIFFFAGYPEEPTMVDIGMAPGGFTTGFLKFNRFGHVFGITPHEREHGTKVVPRYNTKDDRVKVYFGDFVQDPPTFNEKFDLAVCNGEVFCVGPSGPAANPWRKWCFMHAQLIWSVNRLKQDGRLVILVDNIDSWPTIELLNTIRTFSSPGLFKAGRCHVMSGIFWIVANDVCPESEEAKKAIKHWTEILNYALDKGPDSDAWMPLYDGDVVLSFFHEYGTDFLKSAEPIWNSQADALHAAMETDA